MRAALIEYNPHHDEVLPTLTYLLNGSGFEVDVFTTRQNIDKNAFFYCGDSLRYRLFDLDLCGYRILERIAGYAIYDLIVINSIEPERILNRVSRFKRPLLAVVHNGDTATEKPSYLRFLHHGARASLVLATHIHDYVRGVLDSFVVHPVYFGVVPGFASGRKVFAVQGNLDFRRRNYVSLLDAAEALAQKRLDFTIAIIGRNKTKDGTLFRSMMESRNLGPYFRFSDGDSSNYREFYATLKSADYLLPLLDDSNPQYRPYFHCKFSSSMALSIGLSVPSVVQADLADIYELPGSITYGEQGLALAMETAINLGWQDYQALCGLLSEKREEMLSQSLANLQMAVSSMSPSKISLRSTKRRVDPAALVFFGSYAVWRFAAAIERPLRRTVKSLFRFLRAKAMS